MDTKASILKISYFPNLTNKKLKVNRIGRRILGILIIDLHAISSKTMPASVIRIINLDIY